MTPAYREYLDAEAALKRARLHRVNINSALRRLQKATVALLLEERAQWDEEHERLQDLGRAA